MDKAILFEIAFALLLGLGSYYCFKKKTNIFWGGIGGGIMALLLLSTAWDSYKKNKDKEHAKDMTFTSQDGRFKINLADTDEHGIKNNNIMFEYKGTERIQKKDVMDQVAFSLWLAYDQSIHKKKYSQQQEDSLKKNNQKLYDESVKLDSVAISFDDGDYEYFAIGYAHNYKDYSNGSNSEYESYLPLTDSELFRTNPLASKKFELKAPLNGKYFTFIFVNTIKN